MPCYSRPEILLLKHICRSMAEHISIQGSLLPIVPQFSLLQNASTVDSLSRKILWWVGRTAVVITGNIRKSFDYPQVTFSLIFEWQQTCTFTHEVKQQHHTNMTTWRWVPESFMEITNSIDSCSSKHLPQPEQLLQFLVKVWLKIHTAVQKVFRTEIFLSKQPKQLRI